MKRSYAWKKKYFAVSIGFVLLCSVSPVLSAEIRYEEFSDEQIQRMKNAQASIQTKFGTITLKFYPDIAPNHVNNFIELAKSGFYDGTAFHRVIPGFMIQGGDPNSRSGDRETHGIGGPGYYLKAEFSDVSHKRGILSMARAQHPDSAGSQFFICVADSPSLDGKYTVFGEVIDGMAVADEIVSQERDSKDNPVEKIEMQIAVTETDPSDTPDPGDSADADPPAEDEDSGGGGCFIESAGGYQSWRD